MIPGSQKLKRKQIMTMFKERSQHKALTLFVIILLAISIVLALSSCGASKLSRDDKSIEDFAADVLKFDKNGAVTKFIAASRGHDMDSETFEDTSEIKDADIAAAKRILEAAINAQKYGSTEDKDALIKFKDELDAEKITLVVEKLGVKYDLNANPGFFDYILIGIGKALGWITAIVGNSYVVAILLFAVVVEILMLPVAIKQQKNSIGMAKLRPAIARIEKKYAGRTDQVTMRKKQEEIMALQQKEGYSPFSGCLPLLVQLIIVGFILYPIIQNPLRYVLDTSSGFSSALVSYATAPKAAGGLGIALSSNSNVIELLTELTKENIAGIADFALVSNGDKCLELFNSLEIPNFTLFGLEIGRVPKLAELFTLTGFLLILVPVLNVALQFVSMKLTRKWSGTGMPQASQDAQSQASMKIMDLMMPLMTLFIMFQVPALIGIYWLFRSGLSLLKSFIMKKAMPIPKYTEAELKEMEKAEKAAAKAQKEALKEQPKFRSLHYIDEDDYDELPEMKQNNDQKKNTMVDIPDIKD